MNAALKPRWSAMLPQSFDAMQREVDQLFDHFAGNRNGLQSHIAPINMWESEGKWCVEIELPGVQREDIDISLEKNTLRVSAEWKQPEHAERKYWHQERGFGRVERAIVLPENVDRNGVEAELRDGVLHLTLTKSPESLPRKIEVKGSAASQA